MTKLLSLTVLAATCAFCAAVDPFYAGSYAMTNLGSVAGVPGSYGGLTFLAGDNNVLLLGGGANFAGGVIDAVTVTRGVGGHITGFGAVTQFATAPNIDGGLAYGPDGILFYTGYPVNQIGELKPGSTSPDTVQVSPSVSSIGTLNFIPGGFAGAGSLVLGSYNGGGFCTATLTPDGNGTYNVNGCANTEQLGNGPEGIVWVPQGSTLFAAPSALVAQYGTGQVVAYALDAFGLPLAGSGQTFVSGLSGAEGAAIDPVTGDFLFSTFGSGNEIFQVQGFVVPPDPSAPEPGTFVLLTGSLGACFLRRRFAR